MSHYELDHDAPKPCRHCGRTQEHHALNTGRCVTPTPAAPADDALAALCELVALKDLHDQFDAMKQDVPDFATAAVLEGIGAEYRRRKPAAWDRARALVGRSRPTVPAPARRVVQTAWELADLMRPALESLPFDGAGWHILRVNVKRDGATVLVRDMSLNTLGAPAEPAEPASVARPLDDWHEDRGPVLWWRFPIDEPPYCGSPLDSDWPGYHTHWTELPPIPLDPRAAQLSGDRA